MPDQSSPPAPTRPEILAFLQKTPPFDILDALILADLAQRCTGEFHPKGQTILARGKSQVNALRLIYSGRVRLFLRDENGLESMVESRGPGQSIGALAMLRGSLSNLEVVAEQETV
ncbi:MAG: cyclic nucleotide-binding domain-containing protein, partial [Desulfarculus sp.]|nr:cyclic nucleotide-binding domain-containing protein [Desulfarculus sp.]